MTNAAGAKKRRKASSPGLVKDLSFRPEGKKTLRAFVGEKQPVTHGEKQAVVLHWLGTEGNVSGGASVNHVNTAYVEMNWRRPSDLANSLAKAASEKGWFDTSDLTQIQLTARGEDLVRHGLPAKAET